MFSFFNNITIREAPRCDFIFYLYTQDQYKRSKVTLRGKKWNKKEISITKNVKSPVKEGLNHGRFHSILMQQ
jgi:hypothetical protein